jgi:hypothetical protein
MRYYGIMVIVCQILKTIEKNTYYVHTETYSYRDGKNILICIMGLKCDFRI